MATFYISENGEHFEILEDENLVSESGKMLFAVTVAPASVPETGNPIGLLLALTYTT